MIKFFIGISLFIIISNFSFSQNKDTTYYKGNYSIIVDSIIIKGNKITENDIILRELTFGIGDTLTSRIAFYNRERIFSLGIFTKVDLIPVHAGNQNKVIIWVDESWYIYPIPFAELRDNDWSKVIYGLDLMIRNFRGRNETIRIRAGFGYDTNIFLFYDNPFLIKRNDIFFNSLILYSKIKNKSITAQKLHGTNFDQKFISTQIEVGKRIGVFHKVKFYLGYSYVETPFFIKGISASNGRIDRVPLFGAGYIYDTRDLAQFPREGIYTEAKILFKGLGFEGVNYRVVRFDFREYRHVTGDLTAKWRLAARLTNGKCIPYYDYSYLGYSERIRGHFNLEREGNYSINGSAELSYPLLKELNISLNFIPIVPKELLSYRIAVYTELFADAGTTKLNGETLSFNDFISGYGAGLTFLILPYNIIRIEAALDEYKNLEWILGLGISF